MLTEELIVDWAEACGIEEIGFHDASPHEEWLSILNKRRDEGRVTDFENVAPEERIDYQKTFPEIKTVIVAAVPVSLGTTMPKDMTNRGRMAAVAWGRDYHFRVKEKMTALGERIREAVPECRFQVYVDNSRLLDRASAWRAGLGFFGKNNLLINPRYGSFFFIGQLLLDQVVRFEEKSPLESQCGECTRCLKACPGSALEDGFTLDPQRCISYLTQKKVLLPEEEERIKDYLYGCDLCQLSCPFNQEMLKGLSEGGDSQMIYPDLDWIIQMSQREFKGLFGQTAAGWRGKKVLARNAAIIKNRRKNCDNR